MATRFSALIIKVASQIIQNCPPIDALPYTEDFDGFGGVYERFVNLYGKPISRAMVWRALLRVRKAGGTSSGRRRISNGRDHD